MDIPASGHSIFFSTSVDWQPLKPPISYEKQQPWSINYVRHRNIRLNFKTKRIDNTQVCLRTSYDALRQKYVVNALMKLAPGF